MRDLYKNKYRIRSARKADWDYHNEGIYFVTCCVRDQACMFGAVESGVFVPNALGKLVGDCWADSLRRNPHIHCEAFVVMPNHTHALIAILEENKRMGVSELMAAFKSACSRKIHPINPLFAWQERFHDHIVRTTPEQEKIKEYIEHNPERWTDDRYYRMLDRL